MTHELDGVFAAALTPLTNDLDLDLHAIPDYLAHLEGHGCHGALLLGTTGEGPSFSFKERVSVMQSAQVYKRSHPHFRLLVGTGTPSLNESIELTKLAFSFNFDGVVVLPPYYFPKVSDDSLFNWFTNLINTSVPDGGFLLAYNIPQVTGIPFSLDLLQRLKETNPGRFAGIKDSSSSMDFARDLGERFGDDLLVLTGNDKLFSAALNFKAGGCITALANLFSDLSREVWDDFQKGVSSNSKQEKLSSLREILEAYSPYPPILKSMMSKKHGFPLSPVKPPLQDLSEEASIKAFNRFTNA